VPLPVFNVYPADNWEPNVWLVVSFDPAALHDDRLEGLARAWRADQAQRPPRTYANLGREWDKVCTGDPAMRGGCALFSAEMLDVDSSMADALGHREALVDAIRSGDPEAEALARSLWLSVGIPPEVTPRIVDVARELTRERKAGRVELGVALALALAGGDVPLSDALLPRLRAAMDHHCVGPDATCLGWRSTLMAEAYVARIGGAAPTESIARLLAEVLRCYDAAPARLPLSVAVSPEGPTWRLQDWKPDEASPFRACLEAHRLSALGADEPFRLALHE
jgi:hypothetical protein